MRVKSCGLWPKTGVNRARLKIILVLKVCIDKLVGEILCKSWLCPDFWTRSGVAAFPGNRVQPIS
jgi:hypothetical protein